MGKEPLDLDGGAASSRSEDRRLWWQKLADDIAETLSGAIRLAIELWKAWNWRSRWWRNGDDV